MGAFEHQEGAARVMRVNEAEEQQWYSRAVLREHRFHSDVPLVGPLIARFREAWNDVSTRWYVRPLIEQQNALNSAMVSRLLELQAMVADTESWLTQQDQQHTALTHDLAELSAQLALKSRTLSDLEQRLALLEKMQPPGQDAA